MPLAPALAEPDARREAADEAGVPGHRRRRHHADEPADRHHDRHRLRPARCPISITPTASISCRSASSASRSAWCCCPSWRASCARATSSGRSPTRTGRMEFALLLTLPAAVALIALPLADLNTLFEHGVFTAERHAGDRRGARRLRARPARLRPEQGFLARLFRPRGHRDADEVAPSLRSSSISSGSLMLSQFLGHVGIALATALAAWVNSSLLGLTLARRGHYAPDAGSNRDCRASLRRASAWASVLLACALLVSRLFAGGHAWSLRALVLGGAGRRRAGQLFRPCAMLLGAIDIRRAPGHAAPARRPAT